MWLFRRNMRVSKHWCTSRCWLNLHRLVNEEQAEQKSYKRRRNQEARFSSCECRGEGWGFLGPPPASNRLDLTTSALTIPQTGLPLKPLLEGLGPFPVHGARCLTLEECIRFTTEINGLLFKWSLCWEHQTRALGQEFGMPPAFLLPAGWDGASLRRFRVCSAEVGFIIGDWPLLLTWWFLLWSQRITLS